MSFFPYGKAALCIVILMAASAVWLAAHPMPDHPGTLVYWTFAEPHYDSYKAIFPEFEREHPGVTVDLELVSGDAVGQRMQAAMAANLDVPDAFEMSAGDVGMMLRGPLKDVGLLDLTSRVHAPQPGGAPSFYDQCVKARFTMYTYKGRIFGLPHDVHPVQIAYRRDVFAKYHVDVSKIKTWADFIKIGHELTIPGKQYILEADDSDSSQIEPLLWQRGGGYFDKDGNVTLDNEIAVQTMCWYVPLVAGPNKIADSVGSDSSGAQTKAVEDGYMLCYICPDWRTKQFEENVGRVGGKMALMPLPRVTSTSRPTSTWGGTMVGITKHSKNPDLAWQLVMFFYLNKDGVNDRYHLTNILPPVKTQWGMPVFHERRAYWSGIRLGESYAKLAQYVPGRYSNSALVTAENKLSDAVADCVGYYRTHGYPASNDPRFVAFVRADLRSKADQVRALIKRNPF